MPIISDVIKWIYSTYQQYLYTSIALVTILWKRITVGEEYFDDYICEEPDCVKKGWNHKYIQLKKIRMHYVEEGPPDGDVFLMIHGFPEFWYSWRFQLQQFKTTHRCIALDLRGYNLTDKPSGVSSYSIDILVEDIREFIEAIGVKSVILAAHDWGAILSWRVAMYHPDIVKKLIICNVPHPSAFYNIYKSSKEQRSKSWYIYLFQSAQVPEMLLKANKLEWIDKMFRGKKAGVRNKRNFTDEDMQAWKYVFSQPGATTGPLNYYRNLFDAKPVPKENNIVQPPVLILWGAEDAFLDKKGATESVQFCRQCRVHLVPGASHWVQQDEPEIVNEIIRNFIDDDSDSHNLTTTKDLNNMTDKSKL